MIIMGVAIYAVIKKGAPKFGIHTRKTSWLALAGGFVLLIVSGTLSPKPEPMPQATQQVQ